VNYNEMKQELNITI